MKERPILFSAPMVRAILDGTKTQTRRVVKPQPYEPLCGNEFPAVCKSDFWAEEHVGKWLWPTEESEFFGFSPYGQPGTKLWVREALRFTDVFDCDSPAHVGERCVDAGYRTPWAPLQFEADGQRINWQHTGTPPHDGPPKPGKLRPGIHMPRWASRITLEVTSVRVERLQDISDADALAEGVDRTNTSISGYAKERYRNLWEQINGPGSWDANPFVWVVEFRKLG